MDTLVNEIRNLHFNEGKTIRETANALNITLGRVKRFCCKDYDKIIEKEKARQEAEKEFVELVKKYLPFSNSINNLCNNLGLRGVDCYYKKVENIIKENNLSTSHFGTIKLGVTNPRYRGKFTAMSDEEFFTQDSKRYASSIIKRLIDNGYKKYKCENCGINEWNGKKLQLQVHHVNGDHLDNRIDNLQLLCPNCHTQTDNYGGRNAVKQNGFKINNRISEIINNSQSSFKPIDIEVLKEKINHIQSKEKKYCQFCGKEITSTGDKYCSIECAQKASRKYEITAEQIIADFKELKSFSAVGKKYGVTDNAIKKRTKVLGVYDKIREYITPR